MRERAARKDDPTEHPGNITDGHPRVLIGGKEAARIGDLHDCTMHPGGPVATGSKTVEIGGLRAARKGDKAVCVPAALSDAEIAAAAQAFLPNSKDPRADLRNNAQLRRAFLRQQDLADLKKGATSLGMVSNTIQRSRWINTTTDSLGNQSINGAAVGQDLHDEFVGGINSDPQAVSPGQHGLPPTGFKEGFLNDDGLATDDQTHHMAGFTWFSSLFGSWKWIGRALSSAAAPVWDPPPPFRDYDAPQDRALGYAGAKLGTMLGDVDIDINEYIWRVFGGQTGAGILDTIADGCKTVLIGD